jgi:hypothetical protein
VRHDGGVRRRRPPAMAPPVPATMVRRRGERFCFEDLASTYPGWTRGMCCLLPRSTKLRVFLFIFMTILVCLNYGGTGFRDGHPRRQVRKSNLLVWSLMIRESLSVDISPYHRGPFLHKKYARLNRAFLTEKILAKYKLPTSRKLTGFLYQ